MEFRLGFKVYRGLGFGFEGVKGSRHHGPADSECFEKQPAFRKPQNRKRLNPKP